MRRRTRQSGDHGRTGHEQQGRSADIEDGDKFGPREEWGQVWTEGVEQRKKVVKPDDTVWETTRDGKVRVLCSKDTPDVRVFSVDVYEQEIRPGGRSAKHWHMADEVAYVISGEGYSEQWEVEAGDRKLPQVLRGLEWVEVPAGRFCAVRVEV